MDCVVVMDGVGWAVMEPVGLMLTLNGDVDTDLKIELVLQGYQTMMRINGEHISTAATHSDVEMAVYTAVAMLYE
jgi:hypothetical protein